MEAAVVNTLSPGDKVINATIGVFGNRFTDIASAYGADVNTLEFPFGEVIDLDVLRETLKAEPDVKAVTRHSQRDINGCGKRPGGRLRAW